MLGNRYNGIGHYMNALIYYGGPDGWSERHHQRLPAPVCTAVAAGDFNGDSKPDLLGCVEWSVYPFYAHAALEMSEHPRYEITTPRVL